MIAPAPSWSRAARRTVGARLTVAALAAGLMIVAIAATARVAIAGDGPTPSPSIATTSPTAEASPPRDLLSTTFPLPDIVAKTPPENPTVSIEPTSQPGLVVGTPNPFTLAHCGLLSPVDVDGSLWRPTAGVDAEGGPIDGDEEIGELINETAGELTLIDPDMAEFRTPIGSLIILVRAPGALDYQLCM